jgi:hypothetical protein
LIVAPIYHSTWKRKLSFAHEYRVEQQQPGTTSQSNSLTM